MPATEMHWSRWGDPAMAAPLPETAHALVDAFFGTTDTPAGAPEQVRLSDPLPENLLAGLREVVGAEHVLTDHETRLHRTRGKSTPDLLRLRQGDGTDSPDAV
ncbi:MAG TPA: FAD-binding oxidoreductase, partial [Marmoricola sp.]|nr:FAD-binding oxidoreductase [Marmoricola sp.]